MAHASAGAAAATPRCRLSQLSLAQPRSDGALGSIRLRFVFTNSSTTTCKLFGFPGLQMLNSHHANLHTTVIRGTSNVVPPEPELNVVMTPGQHGSFYAGYSDVPTGSQTCPAASFLEVTPPNDFNHFTQTLAHHALRRQDHGLAGRAREAAGLTRSGDYARAPGP